LVPLFVYSGMSPSLPPVTLAVDLYVPWKKPLAKVVMADLAATIISTILQ
jgi:hypothetical protein